MRLSLRYPIIFLDGLLDRAFALAGAILLAQFPQFFSQYLQRLGGHLDELRVTVYAYEKAAAEAGLSLEKYIEEHLASGSEVFISSGEVIAGLVERLLGLEQSYAALMDTAPLSRWLIFMQEADRSIAMETWRSYTPGLPVSVEGFIYAAGLLLGWGIYFIFKAMFRPLYRLLFPAK